MLYIFRVKLFKVQTIRDQLRSNDKPLIQNGYRYGYNAEPLSNYLDVSA